MTTIALKKTSHPVMASAGSLKMRIEFQSYVTVIVEARSLVKWTAVSPDRIRPDVSKKAEQAKCY